MNKYVTPDDVISADPDEIEKYVSKRRYDKIMKIASDSPVNLTLDRTLRIGISPVIRILIELMDEKNSF